MLASPLGVPAADSASAEGALAAAVGARGLATRAWAAAWTAGLTPHRFIRLSGPLGRRICQAYIDAEFVPEADREGLGAYLYHTAVGAPSGEASLRPLLHRALFVKRPLVHRLHELSVPVVFVYGEQDWMDSSHAAALLPTLRVPGRLAIVPRAGHQLFVDNPGGFNAAVTHGLAGLGAA